MSCFALEVDYAVQWETDWHVGSGYGSVGVDRMVRRRGHRGPPYVPGSQIKGVLRYECERLALTLGAEVLDPHATGNDQQQALVRHFRTLTASVLPVDRLFGARREGECLFVSDAVAATCADSLAVVTRTGIDRVTGTVRHQRLFSTEIADEGWRLFGQIRGWHAAAVLTQSGADEFPFEYELLVGGLLVLTRLGGDKGVGRGSCTLSHLAIRWKPPGGKMRAVAPADAVANFALGSGPEGWAALMGSFRGEV